MSGLISFYKQIYLHSEIMLTMSNAKAIIKDNAWNTVIANTSQTGGTDNQESLFEHYIIK